MCFTISKVEAEIFRVPVPESQSGSNPTLHLTSSESLKGHHPCLEPHLLHLYLLA